MAALTKNAILVTVRDRAKRTKIWDHNLAFEIKKKIKNKNLKYNKKCLFVRYRDNILDDIGYNS